MHVMTGTATKQQADIVPLSGRQIGWRQRHRQALLAWSILTPILIYYAIFNIIPVLLNLLVSFTSWDGFSEIQWIGVNNYLTYLKDPTYLLILANTAVFALVILLVQTPLAFFIALLLNQKVAGLGIHRAFWYVPTLTSAGGDGPGRNTVHRPLWRCPERVAQGAGDGAGDLDDECHCHAPFHHPVFHLARSGWAGDTFSGGPARDSC
ncbi:MAG: sugar ABC transporter permease [Ktedonobacteraceae bacterium]|nr:sugar ABC transporter permease [Ktedonobacteraceae bacterium]